MDTKEILHQFSETVSEYIRELEDCSLDQLLWKPSEDEWSLGQMYMHLIGSAQFMQLRNAVLCLEPGGSRDIPQAEKTETGKAVFKTGSFPPERIRVPPSPQYTPSQPESKEQLISGLRDTLRQMTEIEPRIALAFGTVPRLQEEPGKESVPYTVVHPRLGGLNALEWFQLIEIHYRHHVLQKIRLENAWREARG